MFFVITKKILGFTQFYLFFLFIYFNFFSLFANKEKKKISKRKRKRKTKSFSFSFSISLKPKERLYQGRPKMKSSVDPKNRSTQNNTLFYTRSISLFFWSWLGVFFLFFFIFFFFFLMDEPRTFDVDIGSSQEDLFLKKEKLQEEVELQCGATVLISASINGKVPNTQHTQTQKKKTTPPKKFPINSIPLSFLSPLF